eukprot:6212994-Pleurochrysis_carterae.AAC.1
MRTPAVDWQLAPARSAGAPAAMRTLTPWSDSALSVQRSFATGLSQASLELRLVALTRMPTANSCRHKIHCCASKLVETPSLSVPDIYEDALSLLREAAKEEWPAVGMARARYLINDAAQTMTLLQPPKAEQPSRYAWHLTRGKLLRRRVANCSYCCKLTSSSHL